ncbi:MAG TPA: hypothetical protein VMB48_06885 [Steroidobacteraceae bacterium]|nr:hypothetical protein [Steroidobacteraceae bacterium]
MNTGMLLPALALAALAGAATGPAWGRGCDDACLQAIGAEYRAAYVAHDPARAPFARHVRFTEDAAVLPFPDGSWDVVTREVGPALTFTDPSTGGIGIYTAIMMRAVPAFLAIRLRVQRGRITEVEHLLSTKRLVSGPPTPFGDVTRLVHDPEMSRLLTPAQRRPRAQLIRVADGYYATLARNDGTLHTRFAPDCHRIENGLETAKDGCATRFRLGYYRFNERVRREPVLVDEARGLVMFRGFIDHKGTLIDYTLTDGRKMTSPFQEPHTWSFIETFKVVDGEVGPVEADFIGSPYYSTSPWDRHLHP